MSDVVDNLRELPFVTRVIDSSRDDATHCLTTNLTLLRMDAELHAIENLGAETVATASGPHGTTQRVYVRL